jgi:hypothetical protein
MAEKDKFDEFLEEVEQDIRHEKYLKLWRKYGRHASSALIGILVIAAGVNIYHHYETKQRLEAAQKFADIEQLMAKGQIEQALTVLSAMSEESTKTYPVLAGFAQASLLMRQGGAENLSKAVEIYQSLSQKHKGDPSWRELAQILEVYAEIERGQVSYPELVKKLTNLQGENCPWRALALETEAMLHYKNGEKLKASEIFVNLAQDKNTSEGTMMRAQLMSQVLATEELGSQQS